MRKLPLFLKMMSGTPHKASKDTIKTIVGNLRRGKRVILLIESEPHEIYLKDSVVTVEPITQYKYVWKGY